MNHAWSAHAVFEGRVAHCRLEPHEHRFSYPIALAYLNLDRLEEAFAGRSWWSCDRPSIAWLRRGDHLGDPQLPLTEAVRALVRGAGKEARGPICLLTHLRYWGFVMNPVSFYYCFEPAGDRLSALVAEVHNTPWGETHCYVAPGAAANDIWLDKQFHVSPFLPLQMQYRFRFTPPAETLKVEIENFSAGERAFSASLELTRRPWTTPNLRRLPWRYPLQTHFVYAAIYWQALRLWLKGTPYYPHPRASSSSTKTKSPEEVHS
jgi:DUF1365 family protein